MRGKLHPRVHRVAEVRIIPARAGQTVSVLKVSGEVTDHPRACGANEEPSQSELFDAGSSPRVRGKLRYRHYPLLVARIIPAHAGQTCCRRRPSRSRPDHPRACGANNFEESKPLPAIGSSPRMRGKPSTRGLQGTRRRIIPAHAGQTTFCPAIYALKTDHPRACGANPSMSQKWFSVCGSSPRMRGKRCLDSGR